MNNLNSQISSAGKKRIASWILGIISLLLLGFYGLVAWGVQRLLALLIERKSISVEFAYGFVSTLGILYQIGIFIILIFGLINGIKEMKLQRKKSAITGIILCSISLILLILMDLVLLFAFI